MKDLINVSTLFAQSTNAILPACPGELILWRSDFLGLMATPAYVVAGLPNSVLASIQVPDDISQ